MSDLGPVMQLSPTVAYRHDYSGTRQLMGSPGAKAVMYSAAQRLVGIARPQMAVDTGANQSSLTISLYKYRENPNMGAVWTAKVIARGKSRGRKTSHAAAHEFKSGELRKALILSSRMG